MASYICINLKRGGDTEQRLVVILQHVDYGGRISLPLSQQASCQVLRVSAFENMSGR